MLGLTWVDIDYDAGVIRVHRQLDRHRVHAPLKTPAGRRDVILPPGLSRALRAHWLPTRYKTETDFVFTNTVKRAADVVSTPPR